MDKQFEHIEEIEKILDVCGIVAIKKRIKELTNIEPYKFEELKPNMWVWDIETNFIYQIFDTHEEDMSIEVVINDRDIQHLKVVTLCKFEENRFFPVQCDNPES